MALGESYEEFVEKFKPKKTTDDCYTPPAIYEAVKGWAVKEYGIDPAKIVRPFYPGGDYERFEYPKDCVVLDNPPFSILSKILRFYDERSIAYFLFAPTLTIFSGAKNTGGGCIVVDAKLEYENGAQVSTSFVTSLDSALARSAPELYRALTAANRIGRKKPAAKPSGVTYLYPGHVLRAGDIGRFSRYGAEFRVERGRATLVSKLDAQRGAGKAIFGAGVLLSDGAAKAAAMADAAARREAEPVRWELSERERQIVAELSKGE